MIGQIVPEQVPHLFVGRDQFGTEAFGERFTGRDPSQQRLDPIGDLAQRATLVGQNPAGGVRLGNRGELLCDRPDTAVRDRATDQEDHPEAHQSDRRLPQVLGLSRRVETGPHPPQGQAGEDRQRRQRADDRVTPQHQQRQAQVQVAERVRDGPVGRPTVAGHHQQHRRREREAHHRRDLPAGQSPWLPNRDQHEVGRDRADGQPHREVPALDRRQRASDVRGHQQHQQTEEQRRPRQRMGEAGVYPRRRVHCSTTVVPSAPVSNAALPPSSSSMRLTILSRTPKRPAGTRSGSKPTPESAIST